MEENKQHPTSNKQHRARLSCDGDSVCVSYSCGGSSLGSLFLLCALFVRRFSAPICECACSCADLTECENSKSMSELLVPTAERLKNTPVGYDGRLNDSEGAVTFADGSRYQLHTQRDEHMHTTTQQTPRVSQMHWRVRLAVAWFAVRDLVD